MARPVLPTVDRREATPPRVPDRPPPRSSTRALSPRSLLLGLLLTPLCCYWAAIQGVDVIMSLMVPPVAATFMVVILNAIYHRLRPGRELSPGELVVIYGMLSVATAI